MITNITLQHIPTYMSQEPVRYYDENENDFVIYSETLNESIQIAMEFHQMSTEFERNIYENTKNHIRKNYNQYMYDIKERHENITQSTVLPEDIKREKLKKILRHNILPNINSDWYKSENTKLMLK